MKKFKSSKVQRSIAAYLGTKGHEWECFGTNGHEWERMGTIGHVWARLGMVWATIYGGTTEGLRGDYEGILKGPYLKSQKKSRWYIGI